MYDLIEMKYEDRLLHFVEDNIWGGKRVPVLLNKYGLEFRKGKTEADIIKAKKSSMQKNFDTNAFITDYATKLSRILKLKGN